MFNSLSADAQANALFNSPVTAISCATGTDGGGEGQDKDGDFMKISIRGENTPREYSAVISTIPLPSLHFIDLSGAKINEKYALWSAIQSLTYIPALRVGMKFKRAWWRELAKPIYGGRSYTDLVIRTMWVVRDFATIVCFSLRFGLPTQRVSCVSRKRHDRDCF